MKYCKKCDTTKPRSAFNANKSKADGLQASCRECSKAYTRDHYQKNKQYYKDKAHNMDAKRFVHEYLGTHPCVECGERRIPCLQFDHLRDKVETIANAVSRGWSVKRIEAEITKCQVLCANCHAVKTAAQLEWYTTY